MAARHLLFVLPMMLLYSTTATALPDKYREYMGNEYNGRWSGKAVTRGGCRPMSIVVEIIGSSIAGTASIAADEKRIAASSRIVGVIHTDDSVEWKFIKLTGNGRVSIARGLVNSLEITLLDATAPCPYEIRLDKIA